MHVFRRKALHKPTFGVRSSAVAVRIIAGTIKELPERRAREAHDWTLRPQRSRANFAYYARRAVARHPDVLTG
jgi:hypothetical protein